MLYKHNSLLSLPDILKKNASNNINEYNILDNKFKFLNYQDFEGKGGLIDSDINEMHILELKKDNNNFANYFLEKSKKNIIKGVIEIEPNDVNINIILFNTDIDEGIDFYINNKKINIINENNKRKYSFPKVGKYNFEISFNNNINNMNELFNKCSNIISLDLTDFISSNITNTKKCLMNVSN